MVKRAVVVIALFLLLASVGCACRKASPAPVQVDFAREAGGGRIGGTVLDPEETFCLVVQPGSKAGAKFWYEVRRADGTPVPSRAWGKDRAVVLPGGRCVVSPREKLPPGEYRVACYVEDDCVAEIPFRVSTGAPSAVQVGGNAELRARWFKSVNFGRLPAGSGRDGPALPETVFAAGDRIALEFELRQPVRVSWEFRRADGSKADFPGPPDGELEAACYRFLFDVDRSVCAGG
ncbi:MAG: hypothetical protein H5T97_08220, partial [Firmicutes bacterium]|nr:hypothetical protein [Bacillota bacterium]